ncbi:type IV secretion system protein VirB4 [Candidatus Methylacidiphilum fumarolicum]|uniref:Type IV secretory pathway, VirB4 component n=2 Tax=Candidatus Methylacidiphilum fumarolicum TaxID=591154 RepID=I0K0L3_METFB|nr:VirB4 family type IV secretion system protein [Candidatus Methylacidiphilum fumarolicum]MBW6415523.1 VirB4 family type IV secretion system protein [Candidatus Methylacidiphilum fumarolicum]TFE68126.1 type IV secretion system protein VirB4 [Candidatus Methylacidiphilum fumarolicum]TFE73457.1 type IV secretion system protein VirB4 [Candidatus Methylacidiphilum fumarolicum]TFE74376.1 type IV secretion system protein VirB4 [Candidatus Methylacidiphilum fumarolicum]TFE76932.1 type IV secretion s
MKNFLSPFRLFVKSQLFTKKRIPSFIDWADACPYAGLYDRYIIDKFGAVHAFYRTYFPQADIASPSRLVDLQNQLRLLLTQLPHEISQTQHIFTCNGDYGPLLEAFASIPSDPQVKEFRERKAKRLYQRMAKRKLVRIETHTILTVAPSDQLRETEWFLRIGSRESSEAVRKRISKTQFDSAISSIKAAEAVFAEILRKASARFFPLDAYEIADYFFRLWNPGLAVEETMKVNYDYDRMPFVDAWMVQEARIHKDMLQIGDYYHGLVSMVGLPLETRPRDMEKLTVGLPFRDVRVSLVVRKTDKIKELEKLRKRIDWADQRMRLGLNLVDMLYKPHENRRESGIQNIEAWMQIEEAQNLLREIRSGDDDLLQIQLTIHFWHKQQEEIKKRAKILLNRFGDLSRAKGWIEQSSLLPVLMSEMPAVYAPLTRPLLVRGRMAADLMPICRGLESDEKPIYLFGNTTGGLVPLDLEDKRNEGASMLYISGVKGSGKSALAQLIVLRHFLENSILVILDKGNSYDRLVELCGGTTIRLDMATPKCFNPFEVYTRRNKSGELTEPSDYELTKVVSCLEILATSQRGNSLSIEEKNILESLTRQTFSNAVKNKAFYVTLDDFSRQMAYRSDAKFLAESLKAFIDGRYKSWFNGTTQIHWKTRVVHFDFEYISKDKDLAAALIPMAVLFVSDVILSNPNIFKMLVFGEMWQHVSNPATANLIIEAFKTYRKKRCAVIGESQAILDLVDNPSVAKAVIQNVDTWILFPQGSEHHIEYAVKELELTQGQRDLLTHLRSAARVHLDGEVELWREAFYLRGRGPDALSGVIRAEIEPEEYWLTTTTPNDFPAWNAAKAAFSGDIRQTLEALSIKYPLGIREEKIKVASSIVPYESLIKK